MDGIQYHATAVRSVNIPEIHTYPKCSVVDSVSVAACCGPDARRPHPFLLCRRHCRTELESV